MKKNVTQRFKDEKQFFLERRREKKKERGKRR